jgi:cytochrome c5
MKAPSAGALMATLIGMAVLTLTAIGAPHDRKQPEPATPEAPAPAPASVSAGGFTLASTSIELPSEDAPFPDGPHADVINAHCTSCHSASMALTQPPLSADQWKAVVTKMRESYHAPVADGDVPAILDYLGAMPGQTPKA